MNPADERLFEISLDPEQAKRVRARAGQLDVSFSEYVRRLIERDLGEKRDTADVSALFNLGSSGGSDIVCEQDQLLGEAFDAAYRANSREIG